MNLNLSINNIPNLSEIERKHRQQSLDNFLVSGFPNKKLEDWKFTDFNQIISAQFSELSNKIEENKIRGCVSNLWVTGEERQDGTMYYKHDADAFITKGTAKIIVDLVNGEQMKEIAELTLESFKGLGIRELLTMQRQVGFASLIERVVRIANG